MRHVFDVSLDNVYLHSNDNRDNKKMCGMGEKTGGFNKERKSHVVVFTDPLLV